MRENHIKALLRTLKQFDATNILCGAVELESCEFRAFRILGRGALKSEKEGKDEKRMHCRDNV